MPLRVPQEPIITEQKNGGVTTPAPLAVPDQDATVRTNPITGELNVLGVVAASTNRFRTRSPALCWMPSSRVGLTTKPGALRGGRETFVTMRLSEPMTFDGVDGSKDRTDFYLAALNSHCHRSFDSASLSSKPSAAHDFATGRSRHTAARAPGGMRSARRSCAAA
jgi:hypothetical protein